MANDIGWGAVSAVAGISIAVGSFLTTWFKFGAGSAGLKAKAESAEAKAKLADASAAAALGKFEILRGELSDLREKTGDKIARLETKLEMTADSMTSAEERVADGLKDISRELAQMSQRIDRALEVRSKHP